MTNKEENIKSRIKLLINNIDEFGCKFVIYKAESIKNLLKDTLKYINNKEQECEELKGSIIKIFACLIKANRTNKIVDTLWVDNITTLWDYIAQTLGIEGDQVQIEEQILQKISECEVTND